MSDLSHDVLAHSDFSSKKGMDKALARMRDLSDELIYAIARFKLDSKRRRALRKFREANLEGTLAAPERHMLENLATQSEDFSIAECPCLSRSASPRFENCIHLNHYDVAL